MFFFSLLLFATSCEDDDLAPADVRKINNFIKKNMDDTYFWNDEMPGLNPNKQYDSEKYFNALLYDEIDQWSFITDDYKGLQKYFSGIRKSMGHSIRLFRLADNSNDLIGFIEYTYPESPAARAGLERGNMFYKINDQRLTIDNYSSLLSTDVYKMTLGTLNKDNSITPHSPEIKLIAEELSTNPILVHKVIQHGGKKIGYLAYTSFIHDYNTELESVFAEFKTASIDELVLDLRYNGGGAVSSAILMSSMIAPANKANEIFIRTAYNSNLEDYFKKQNPGNPDLFNDRLTSHVNNLNLNRLVALTTYKTASASEMVMYGLSPHMDVYHIGEQTHGKYYGSITIDDSENHNWAIQPIVMRVENENNSINYSHGLIPNEEVIDFLDATAFYQLGDIKEDFLARALYHITGELPEDVVLKSAFISPLAPLNKEYRFLHRLDFDMQFQLQ